MCIIVVSEMFPLQNNDIKSNPLHNKVKITRFKFQKKTSTIRN